MAPSAYSLHIDWQRFRDIADEVDALVLADVAHYAGLIAGGEYPSPVGIAQFVTTTTHKGLRGPRGGLIMADAKYAKKINSAVFPGLQGGPLLPMIGGKAVSFAEALKPDFKEYCKQVILTAQALAEELSKLGLRIVSGRTECHMFLVDLTAKNVAGNTAEEALDRAHITLNKNAIPNDPRPPMEASGIRIGTSALATRNIDCNDCRTIARLIMRVLDNIGDNKVEAEVAAEVSELCARRPIYPPRD